MLFEGAAFCPHCGAARSRSASVTGETVRCPACRGEMRWVRIGNTDLLECGDCDGTWVEADTFARLCADRERQAAVSQQRPQRDASARRADAVRYRPCPRCGKLMNRMNFGRLSGTIVDVCRGHGTFLDRGELHQVVDFIWGGGLDRARQAERDDIAEERRRLKELLAALAKPL
jgi:Zn-finger nucleic acid-binding protein